jgi:hypothetical protein
MPVCSPADADTASLASYPPLLRPRRASWDFCAAKWSFSSSYPRAPLPACLPACWNKCNITPSHPGRTQRPLASLSAPRITSRVTLQHPPRGPRERRPCALTSGHLGVRRRPLPREVTTEPSNHKTTNANAVPLGDDVRPCGRGIGDNWKVPPYAERQVITEYPTLAADHHLAQDDPFRSLGGQRLAQRVRQALFPRRREITCFVTSSAYLKGGAWHSQIGSAR